MTETWWANSQPPAVEASGENDLTSQSRLLFVTLSGGLGGAVGDTVMHSLDTVKTRQQAAPYEKQYRTMIRAYWTIGRYEGITRGLYGGYGAAVVGSFPTTSAFFFVYESSKRYMKGQLGVPDTLTHLTAGFLGDFACSFVYVPSEVLKTRLQLQGRYNNPHFHSGYNYRGLIDAFKTIIKTEGYQALFFGYKATLMRDLPFSALQFAFYEKFHDLAQSSVGKGIDMGLFWEMATGAGAGGLAGIITTPLDVVKTRTQTQKSDLHNNNNNNNNNRQPPRLASKSVFASLGTLYRQQGISGLFSGVGPRFVWTSVQSSIMLVLYQYILREFNLVFPNTGSSLES